MATGELCWSRISSFAIDTIKKADVQVGDCASLIRSILQLVNRDWFITLIHVFRESNRVADKLANIAASLPLGFQLFHAPSSEIAPILVDDRAGVSFPRLVNL